MSYPVSLFYRYVSPILIAVTLAVFPSFSSAEPSKPGIHGEFVDNHDAGHLVFDVTVDSWVTPVEFWRNYAEGKGGLTWGESDRYPNYDEVSEFDTFLVRVAEGPCLMEFFHGRWRRANDVRRWNPMFNEVLGCASVFD